METFAAKKKRSATVVRKAHSYVHHPMGPAQQVQQTAMRKILRPDAVQAKPDIGEYDGKYEQETDHALSEFPVSANSGILSGSFSEAPSIQRSDNEEPEEELQRQSEEEEESIQAKLIQRQPDNEDDDEPVQTKLVQRQMADMRGTRPARFGYVRPEIKAQQAEIHSILHSTGVQAKPTIGQPNDKYEQEADRVADQVMAMPDSNLQRQPESEGEEKILQTKLLADQITPLVQRQEEAPEEEEELQTKSKTSKAPAVTPSFESKINSIKGGGQPLDAGSRSFFEPRFGRDFSNVRVHSDSAAADNAKSINARAFTLGNDMVMGSNEYKPHDSSGQALIAHELTHVIQQGKALQSGSNAGKSSGAEVSASKNDGSMINRWSGHEHKAFGNDAAKMAKQHSDKFTISLPKEEVVPEGIGSKGDIGIAHGSKGKTMSLGEATELSGDYTASPRKLGEVESSDPSDVWKPTYLLLASTNINHFFPLADKEWRTQHATALGVAGQAGAIYRSGNKAEGDRLSRLALQTEGFGLHFLQDSFASGHQYPRALERVDASWVKSGYRGYKRAKTYHDALCALPNGLDMAIGGKFHGDDTAEVNGQDKRVTIETYNSLAEVLCAISGAEMKTVGATAPAVNLGPDVGKIMQDPEAGPIWYSLECSLVDLLKTAKANKDGTVTTDSGITYDVSQILADWGGRKGADAPELADPDMRSKLVAASFGGKTSLIDTSSDDDIVSLLKNEEGKVDVNLVPKNLTVKQTVMLCKSLISGACIGTDEHAVLFILRRQSHGVFRAAVASLTVDYIDSGLDWHEWDTFLLVCANRYNAGGNIGAFLIASEKNDDAARMLINGGSGEKPVKKSRLSGMEWIGVVNALLSGVCTDADEDAIVAIVDYLAKKGKAGLVHTLIGSSRMDSGVDGKQWGQIRSIMKNAGYNWSWWG